MNIAYNADCVEAMRKMQDDTVDLIVTSPPYDDLRTYNGYSFDWKVTLQEFYRVVKIGGVVVWIVADQTKQGSETGSSFRQALYAIDCGFNLHDTMIWNKGSTQYPDKCRYYSVFEYMFVFSKGQPKTINLIRDKKNKNAGASCSGTTRQRDGSLKVLNGAIVGRTVKEYGVRPNIWSQPRECNNRTGHPAVFPIRLAEDHIRTWSNEGDLVMDPFMGSGTTRIAAYNLSRSFIGFEIDSEYFKKQEERFAAHLNI